MTDDKGTRDKNVEKRSDSQGPVGDASHVVGTGLGGLGGVAAGAAVGSMAGPVGTVVGGVVGGLAGGVVGNRIAAAINPAAEDDHWRQDFPSRPYADGLEYSVFQPAYKLGWESYGRHTGKKFDEVEPELKREWERDTDSAGRISWDKAKDATRDAWHRVERAMPGDADGDGR